jgi:bidirectional [NiFe] hydrogenase diaphorase subunit
MPEIILNGQRLKAKTAQTVLEVARAQGVFIPTLCYHPGLGPYGACRLCLVEVKTAFRPGLSSSCSLRVMDGLVVETDSPLVKEGRRLVAELLLARAPQSREIRTLAESLGIKATDLPQKDELCILCGRCVRACKALGIDAISFARRGAKRHVAVPFHKPSEHCMACQACTVVCPTGAIKAKITPHHVEMVEWQTQQPLQRCVGCGQHFVTERQQDRISEIIDSDRQPRGALCPQCRRRETAKGIAFSSRCRS